VASIRLDHVSVSFPIYSAGGRSIRTRLMAAGSGGRIGTEFTVGTYKLQPSITAAAFQIVSVSGMDWLAVSDVNADELTGFVQKLARESGMP